MLFFAYLGTMQNTMRRRQRKTAVNFQGAPLLLGLTIVLCTLVAAGILARYAAGNTRTVDIGVEHDGILHLTLRIGYRGEHAITEISHDGTDGAFLSLPAEWTLREVRNGQLGDIGKESPSFGFIRWRVPQTTAISFLSPTPDRVTVHNASSGALTVRLSTIDFTTGQTTRDVLLIQETPTSVDINH